MIWSTFRLTRAFCGQLSQNSQHLSLPGSPDTLLKASNIHPSDPSKGPGYFKNRLDPQSGARITSRMCFSEPDVPIPEYDDLGNFFRQPAVIFPRHLVVLISN